MDLEKPGLKKRRNVGEVEEEEDVGSNSSSLNEEEEQQQQQGRALSGTSNDNGGLVAASKREYSVSEISESSGFKFDQNHADGNGNGNGVDKKKEKTTPLLCGHAPDETLLAPFRYLLSLPGKDIRGKLIDAFQTWLSIPEDRIGEIKKIIGDLHTASLLVDDIEDGSSLRRGKPVAHSIYGLPITLNCANYVYFIAMQSCIQMGNGKAMLVFTEEMLNLHRGQGQDILWRDSIRCPTTEQYIEMVKDKTGGLFRLAVRLMQCFSTTAFSEVDFTPLTNKMAIYFQVRDDFINLASPQYHKNKSYCEDLTEGKFSFPIIHSIHQTPDDTRLISILKQHTKGKRKRKIDDDVKGYAVEWMKKKTNSLKFTREFLLNLEAEIREEIQKLGGHKDIERLLSAISKDVTDCEC